MQRTAKSRLSFPGGEETHLLPGICLVKSLPLLDLLPLVPMLILVVAASAFELLSRVSVSVIAKTLIGDKIRLIGNYTG